MWASNAERHGAAGAGRVWVVVDMVRRKEERRCAGLEAILWVFFQVLGRNWPDRRENTIFSNDDDIGKPCPARHPGDKLNS